MQTYKVNLNSALGKFVVYVKSKDEVDARIDAMSISISEFGNSCRVGDATKSKKSKSASDVKCAKGWAWIERA